VQIMRWHRRTAGGGVVPPPPPPGDLCRGGAWPHGRAAPATVRPAEATLPLAAWRHPPRTCCPTSSAGRGARRRPQSLTRPLLDTPHPRTTRQGATPRHKATNSNGGGRANRGRQRPRVHAHRGGGRGRCVSTTAARGVLDWQAANSRGDTPERAWTWSAGEWAPPEAAGAPKHQQHSAAATFGGCPSSSVPPRGPTAAALV